MSESEYRVQWTGSRDGPLESFVWELAHGIGRYTDRRLLREVFAHGGAKGVDTAVGEMAKACGIESRVWLPDWQAHGRKAGILRNEEMVDEFKPTIGIGLNWNNSPGTRHCVSHMRSKGIPVLSIEYTGDPEGNVFPF